VKGVGKEGKKKHRIYETFRVSYLFLVDRVAATYDWSTPKVSIFFVVLVSSFGGIAAHHNAGFLIRHCLCCVSAPSRLSRECINTEAKGLLLPFSWHCLPVCFFWCLHCDLIKSFDGARSSSFLENHEHIQKKARESDRRRRRKEKEERDKRVRTTSHRDASGTRQHHQLAVLSRTIRTHSTPHFGLCRCQVRVMHYGTKDTVDSVYVSCVFCLTFEDCFVLSANS
jgi:hypothetical protein